MNWRLKVWPCVLGAWCLGVEWGVLVVCCGAVVSCLATFRASIG